MAKASCTIVVNFRSAKEASDAGALVEREAAFKKRGSARVSIKNSALTIEIGADDLPAMRAMLNTYLRTLQVSDAVAQAVEKQGQQPAPKGAGLERVKAEQKGQRLYPR